MNAEAQIKSALYSAMAAAFAEIEGATKAAINPHFGKKYADLGAVLAAIKPPLIAHGLFFTQRTQPSDDGVIVDTVLHHSSGEEMNLGSLYVPADKRDAQKFGSALSYARRYALLTAFGVPTEDDDGNAAVKANGEVRDPTIPGITKIRNNLNKLRRDGGKATDLETFNALISANKDDLQKIKDAEHSLWTGMGEDFDGFKAWIKRRREELADYTESASYQLLVSTLLECTTRPELDAWNTKNMALVDILSDDERRKFETAYDAAEATILAAAPLGAG